MCSYIGQRPPEKPNTWDRMHEVPSPSERAAPRELSLTRGLGALDGRQLQANLEGAVYSWNSNPNWQLDGPRPVHGELDLHWYRVVYPSLRSRDPPPRPSLRWKLQGDLRNGDLDRQWNDGRHKSLLLYDSMLLRPNGPRIGRHPRARVVAPPTAPPSNGELYWPIHSTGSDSSSLHPLGELASILPGGEMRRIVTTPWAPHLETLRAITGETSIEGVIENLVGWVGWLWRRETVVSCCESIPEKTTGPWLTQGAGAFFVLNSVVSFVVILLQFPVDLRGPTHNTDAQNIA